MKKAELKKMLKPIVAECIRECLFEDGILAGVIAECVKGLNTGNQQLMERQQTITTVAEQTKQKVLQEQPTDEEAQLRYQKALEQAKKERAAIKRMGEVTGLDPKLFEGVEPAPPQKGGAARQEKGHAFRGIDPNDKGVDISGLLKVVGGAGTWKKQLPKKEG